jgi:hypothetical protein
MFVRAQILLVVIERSSFQKFVLKRRLKFGILPLPLFVNAVSVTTASPSQNHCGRGSLRHPGEAADPNK